MCANVTTQWMGKSIPQNIKNIVSKSLQQLRCTESSWKWMRLWWLACPTSRACQWWDSETCGCGMWAWMWEMHFLFPAQTLACFTSAQIIGLFTLHTEIAGDRTAWILRHLGTSAGLSSVDLYLLSIWVVLVCWSFLPSFVCWPSLCACFQEDPYPCLVKQSQKRTLRKNICCNHISWDQLYQLHLAYDTLSCSHKNEVSHLAHLAAALTWRLVHALSFWRRSCICSVQTDLQLPPCKGWCSWAEP